MGEAVNDGKRPDTVEGVSTMKFFMAIGKLMIPGKAVVDYPWYPISTTVQEHVQCSACSKVGYQCPPQVLEKGP